MEQDEWFDTNHKWMYLNSSEGMSGVEPYLGPDDSDPVFRMMDTLYPEREDGSRDMGNHTIMTREAWVRMLEQAKVMMGEAKPKPPVYPEWMAKLYGCDRFIGRYSINHPRQNGHQRIYSIVDEWLYAKEQSRIDTARLHDSAYLAELQDRVLEEVAQAERPPPKPNVYIEMLKRICA